MKKANFKLLFLLFMLISFTFVSNSFAQTIDNQNKVEYHSETSDFEDLNEISKKRVSVKRRNKKKVRAKDASSNISLEDLKKISNLRFRKKKRSKLGKCLKEVKTDCSSIVKKAELLRNKQNK